MAGSAAEERLRAKTEALMRRRYPEARIVHELVLDQGGVRIDLAAVGPDQLVVAEIKSARDTLKRLKDQVATALDAAQEVWIVLAPKHLNALVEGQAEQSRLFVGMEPVPNRPGVSRGVYRPNPAHVPRLNRCWIWVETEDGIAPTDHHIGRSLYDRTGPRPTPHAMLDMLWAEELRALGLGGDRDDRETMIRRAIELRSGAEIRRGVCAQLRSRPFPRADEPVEAPRRTAHKPQPAETLL